MIKKLQKIYLLKILIYYFRYKYFKDLINYFDKSKNENKSDINKLRGVYIDVLKAYEKFKILKNNLEKIDLNENQINSMVFGISNINNLKYRII